jgi:hypothetical protein
MDTPAAATQTPQEEGNLFYSGLRLASLLSAALLG